MNIKQYKLIFGKNLKKCRVNSNLTQAVVAEIWKKSNDAISKIENGENAPGFELLLEIADYFDESLDYLLGRNSVKGSELLNKINRLSKRDKEIINDLINVMLSHQ